VVKTGGLRSPWRLAALASVAVVLSACNAGPAPTTVPPVPTATPTIRLNPTHPPLESPTGENEPQIGTLAPEAIFTADLTVGTFVFADAALWAFDASGVTRIDTGSNASEHLVLLAEDGTERFSVFGAVGFGSIWVSDFDLDEVRRYDEGDGSLQAVIDINDPEGVIVAGDSVWVAEHRDGSVARIDPERDEIAMTVDVGTSGSSGPERLIAFNDQIWTGIPRDRAVAGIDPSTNAVLGPIEVVSPGNPCGDIGGFGERLFISGCATSQSLAVVDIATMEAVASPEFAGGVTGPVTVGDQLWLGVIGNESSLTSLDPVSLVTGRSLPVTGGFPLLLFVAEGSIWVSVEREPAAWILRLPLTEFE
jgi:hypothetical protein